MSNCMFVYTCSERGYVEKRFEHWAGSMRQNKESSKSGQRLPLLYSVCASTYVLYDTLVS